MSQERSDIGFLFDWDGVVVDSSKQHEESWERLAKAEGLQLYEGHFKEGFGKKNTFIIPNLLKWTTDAAEIDRLSDLKEWHYRQIVVETGLVALPGVRGFLDQLVEGSLPRCVASSTPRENIDAVLELIGLNGYFSDIVAAGDVGQGKPHPEVFLKAAAKIGMDARDCIVFEDSFSGIEAGLASGARVVAFTTTNPRSALEKTGAHLIVDSFEELSVERLRRLNF